MPDFTADPYIAAEVVPSPNVDERKTGAPDMILLHYTGMQDGRSALERLCAPESKVSAHYVVFEDGQIVQCVPEAMRAWHAGTSYWAGQTDINSCSIGIEVVNPGHDFGYPDFPLRQVAAVISLCKSIHSRWKIPADRVLGHSDVAPARKQDPGEKFPWELLSESNVGHGYARPRSISKAAASSRASKAKTCAGCSARCGSTATASRRAAAMARKRATSSPPSSAISARSGWMASRMPRPC